jgi:hypothetical protein
MTCGFNNEESPLNLDVRGRTQMAKRRTKMLETLAIILIILWILGLVTSYTMGGLIHTLLVIAVVVILVRIIQGRRL